MSESKHKIFVNRNWLSISIAVIIVAFLLAYLIMYFTKVALYVQIIVYCLILLLGIALIIHFLKFIIFAPGYIEIIDYRYLRKKSIVIKIEDIDKVHLDYIYNRSALIYYHINNKSYKQILDFNLKVLTSFVKYMPKVKYKIESIDVMIDPIPQSHREVLAKLNVINKEPF